MTAVVLDGRAVAHRVFDTLGARVERLTAHGAPPQLVFVCVGSSAPAQIYLRRLEKIGKRIGAVISHQELPESIGYDAFEEDLCRVNARPDVDGILVQMPLPDHLAHADLSGIITQRKDVDGVTVANVGHLYLGLPGQMPPTALAMMEMATTAGISPTGAHAVVVGRSNVVGHPVTELLLQQDATVTVTHRQTADLGHHTRQADLLFVGAGEPNLIRAGMIRPGVVIVDAGINVTEHGVVGDVAYQECAEIAAAITPVPGGVGPVTNAMLLRNLVDSAEHRGG